MKPQSIVRFEQLYLFSAVLGVLNLFVNFGTMSERASAVGTSPGTILIGAGLGWLMIFLFWYFITRRASNIAKWILVVMTGIGLIGITQLGALFAFYGPLYAALTTLVTLVQLAAIVFLFRQDAVVWLKGKGAAVDPATFN